MYRSLQSDKIISTLEALARRISGRFPGSGLWNVCADLVALSRQTSSRITEVTKPHWGLRLALAAVQLTTLAMLAVLARFAATLRTSDELSDFLQGFDAAVSLAIFVGGAAFFVWTFEGRWKRDRALKALHEIRAIVHVIDMHQLTKDPSMLGAARVSSSPERTMTPFELMRYLDYCSEMLSLTAKLAALYAEKISDPVVVDTVGDIERLTSALSAKIWQKISMVQQLEGRDMPLPTSTIGSTPQMSPTPSLAKRSP
ncbi:MAG: hypothetical protein ABL907_23370 [Hyphomicrobium sp.]